MLAPRVSTRADGLRIMHYCHDSYGLGHLRRTLALAHRVREREPDATQLLVTGAAHSEGWALPQGADWVKLPAVVKVGADAYLPRSLGCSFDATLELRKDIVFAAARRFSPDVVVVDHVPGGLAGEALPALQKASADGARLILGLRDVLDDAALVHRSWRQSGVHELLEGLYDRIVIYGDPTVYDVVEAYGFSSVAAAKTRYVGYLEAPLPRPRAAVRRELGIGHERMLLVTAGGGEDGYSLLGVTLAAVAADPPPHTTTYAVTGPLMPDGQRRKLEEIAENAPHIRVVSSVPDLADLVAASDAVVSMGGYNTVREILTYRRPALVVPRVQPRLEQHIRAEALARRGLIRMLHPDELSPERLHGELRALLTMRQSAEKPVALGGLDGFADALVELVDAREAHAA